MKFNNPIQFDNQLRGGEMSLLAPLYLLAVPSNFERKRLIARIEKHLRSGCLAREESLECTTCDMSSKSIGDVMQALASQSLFGGKSLVVADSLEKLPAKQLKSLEAYVINPSPSAYLILSSQTAKPLAPIYSAGKTQSLYLDLTGEKPWERRDRMALWVHARAKQGGKRIASDALAHLLEKTSGDLAALDSEMSKLILYVGSRPEISLSDARKISSDHVEESLWEIAENCIWGDGRKTGEFSGDLSALITLMGALRYHLSSGLMLAACLDAKRSPPASIKPFFIKKHSSSAHRLGVDHFKSGLCALQEIELLAKSASISPAHLWIMLAGRLRSAYASAK